MVKIFILSAHFLDRKPCYLACCRSNVPPPVPTQSLPNTTLVSSRHLDTYLTPALHDVHTVADVHQQSDSSNRVARQQQQQQAAESPKSSSSASGESDGDGDDENEEKDPYATIDTTTKLRQAQGQGNVIPAETGFMRQRSGEGRRSENFFDSDQSSLDNKERPSEGEGNSYIKLVRDYLTWYMDLPRISLLLFLYM